MPAGKYDNPENACDCRRCSGPAVEDACEMTVADITLVAFTLCNSARVAAYVPQITRAATDRGGAQAISFATWGLFLLSNVTAVAYALVNKGDWAMAAMFLGNAVGCAAIILIGAWKRTQHRNRQMQDARRQARGTPGRSPV
jgi:hypothetical protein